MYQQILDALKKKFAGVNDKILERMAKKMAKTTKTEDEVQTAVDGVTFQQIIDSEGDRRANEATDTAVRNYETKHNLKDGKPVAKPNDDDDDDDDDVTLDDDDVNDDDNTKGSKGKKGKGKKGMSRTEKLLQQMLDNQQKINERLDRMDGEKTATSRKSRFEELLKDAPEKVRTRYMRDYDRLSFKDDADYDQWLEDITPEIDQIGSGLGHALPKSALVVPLLYNKDLTGIIEIYSFKVLQQYQIAFVEKLAENIASTISTVKINGQTAQLLEKSKRQAEILEQQEEKIRQNMEEMQATQEESTQKEEELTTMIEGFSSVMPTVRYDTNQRIIDVNDEYATLVNTKKDKLIGKRHKSELIMDEQEQIKHEKFWEELLKGNPMETEELLRNGKKEIWMRERFVPVFDTEGKVTEVMALGYNINDQKEIENQIQMIQEGVIPEKLKKKIEVKGAQVETNLIDLTNLNVVYKNDAKKIDEILRRYVDQIPEQLTEISDLIKDRNYKSMKTSAKSLKTKLNYLGIKQMYNAIDSIIKLIDDDKNLTAMPGLFKPMKAIWEAAGAELTDILNKKA